MRIAYSPIKAERAECSIREMIQSVNAKNPRMAEMNEFNSQFMADVLDLPLLFVGTCQSGAYKGYAYRVSGTDHAFAILGGHEGDFVELERDYFARSREFGRKARSLAKKYNLAFDLVCALRADEECIKSYLHSEEFWTTGVFRISEEMRNELSCGIRRRKAALTEILLDDVPIEQMGQKHSKVLADAVLAWE